MESIQILPITEKVPFTAYQTRGFEAGILLANVENAKEFLFNRCINYFFRRTDGKISFDYTCDKRSWFLGQDVFFRQTYSWDPEQVSRAEMLNMILNWLDNRIYVYGMFNERYIPCKSSFGKQDFRHGYLIYGCDQTQELFFAMGYTDNRRFEKYTIAYSDFFNAIEHVKDPVFWLRYLNPNRSYSFDLFQVYWELRDYLYSAYTVQEAHGKRSDEQYGVSANHALREYALNIETHGGYLDPRYSRLFFENKLFMAERLAYMHQKHYIGEYSNAYSQIAQRAHTIHFLFLKYNLTGNSNILHSIDRLFGEVNDADERLLSRVLDEMTAFFAQERQGHYI